MTKAKTKDKPASAPSPVKKNPRALRKDGTPNKPPIPTKKIYPDGVPQSHRDRVHDMAKVGGRNDHIALAMGLKQSTLERYFKEELRAGRAEGYACVDKTLFNMATSEKNIVATIFFQKSRQGYSDYNNSGRLPMQPVTGKGPAEEKPMEISKDPLQAAADYIKLIKEGKP